MKETLSPTLLRNPKIKLTKGDWEPAIGQVVEVTKYFETTIFGFSTTGWMNIASAKVISEDNDYVTIKVIEEKSEIKVNGKKKNHFEKGNQVKIEWRGKAQTESHLEFNGTDTLIAGQYKCGERYGQWKWFFDNNKVKSIAHYTNGEYDGDYQIFNEDGHMLESGSYVEWLN